MIDGTLNGGGQRSIRRSLHLHDQPNNRTLSPSEESRWTFLEIGAVLLILVVGAVLRFADLSHRGLIYWDEGKFALEGIRFLTLSHNFLGAHDPITLGKSIGTAKPGHAVLIALTYAVVGVHDYAPLYMNSVCSLVGIVLTYLIGRRLFGRGIALAGALFLATAEYDIVYARSALSEDDASAVLLLAVWLWLRGTLPRLPGTGLRSVAIAGVVAGLAFTVSYRMLIYIVVLVGVDLALHLPLRSMKYRPFAVRCAVWAAALAAAPLLWEMIDLVARSRGVILFRNEIAHAPTSYLLQALYQIHEGKQSVVRFEPLPYLQWFFVRQGVPGLVLLLGSVAFALWRRTVPLLLVLSFIAVPYAVYITAPFVVPRNMNAAVPFAALLIAALLGEIPTVFRRRPAGEIAFLTAAVLLCIFNGVLAWRVMGVRSGMAEAARYVQKADGGKAVVANEIMVFYLRGGASRCFAPRMPYSETQLQSDIQFGFRYAVLDQYSGSTMDWLVKHHTSPVAQWPSEGNLSLGESLIASENTITPDTASGARVTRVYDLTRLHLPPITHPRYPGCDREAPP